MKKTMASESTGVYGTGLHDLEHPLILQQEGHPLAVLVPFEEYQRLQALAADEVQRQQGGWQTLRALLDEVHARPSSCTTEQIEVEIGIAREEVRQSHAG